jgi:cation-transporting P-type ATPase 13A2
MCNLKDYAGEFKSTFTKLAAQNNEDSKQLLVSSQHMLTIQIFSYRFVKFKWNEKERCFKEIRFDVEKPFSELIAMADKRESQGKEERDFWRMMYGPGEIVVPPANPLLLFIDELMNPFYMFTIFSLGIWYWEEYTVFAIVLSVLAGVSILTSVWDTWAANRRVRNLAKYTCNVRR